MDETVEVDRDYLWALEVLACDSMNIEGETSRQNSDRYANALAIAEKANLNRPINREYSDKELAEHYKEKMLAKMSPPRDKDRSSDKKKYDIY